MIYLFTPRQQTTLFSTYREPPLLPQNKLKPLEIMFSHKFVRNLFSKQSSYQEKWILKSSDTKSFCLITIGQRNTSKLFKMAAPANFENKNRQFENLFVSDTNTFFEDAFDWLDCSGYIPVISSHVFVEVEVPFNWRPGYQKKAS